MIHRPDKPSADQNLLSDILNESGKQKVKLTPEIEKEIREHLAEAQARAEKGEPMTQEMAEFMENVRMWAGMPEAWRNSLKTVEEMKKDSEVMGQIREAPKEAKQRHISVQQWLNLLHVAEANGERDKKRWIDKTFQFPGEGKIETGEELNLTDCSGLTSLPEGLRVKGNLWLDGCTGLTSLPEDLIVEEELWVDDLSNLTSLPEGLRVNGNLYLGGCTGLTSLPEKMWVGDNLYLSTDLNRQVKEDAERLIKARKINHTIIYED